MYVEEGEEEETGIPRFWRIIGRGKEIWIQLTCILVLAEISLQSNGGVQTRIDDHVEKQGTCGARIVL